MRKTKAEKYETFLAERAKHRCCFCHSITVEFTMIDGKRVCDKCKAKTEPCHA